MRDRSRREFLKATAAGLALGLAGKPSFLEAKDNPDLAVVSGDPPAATKRALELIGGISHFVKKGQLVVIKPCMSFGHTPDKATNTHPQVVATVAQACIGAGAERVVVLDHVLGKPEKCLELSGIPKACQGIKNVKVVGTTERKYFQDVKFSVKGKVFKMEAFKEFSENPVLISIPVAKNHRHTGITMGIKGLLGLIWNRTDAHPGGQVNEQFLADLAMMFKPPLTILDATRALLTGGNTGPGEIQKLNLVVAGADPVAVDSYGVTLAPWNERKLNSRQVAHLLIAHKMGLGKIDVEQMKIIRESV